MKSPTPNTIWKHWNEIEQKIKEEERWLTSAIQTFGKEEKTAPKGCRVCFIRKIAILIVSGQVKASDITKDPSLKSLWKTDKRIKTKKIFHGKDWHREMMKKIEKHFISQGYKVTREPNVHGGRADLSACKNNNHLIFIEIGTTCFFKLWLNLQATRNFTYLIIPDDDRIIEFIKTTKG